MDKYKLSIIIKEFKESLQQYLNLGETFTKQDKISVINLSCQPASSLDILISSSENKEYYQDLVSACEIVNKSRHKEDLTGLSEAIKILESIYSEYGEIDLENLQKDNNSVLKWQ